MSPSSNPGTKTQFAVQLIEAEEGTLVGAHPSLGMRLARRILEEGLIPGLAPEKGEKGEPGLKSEVTQATDWRLDFAVRSASGETLVEVKNVVCADYAADAAPERRGKDHCVIVSGAKPYERTAPFPWGTVKQTYEGTTCVSERAIKHLTRLTAEAQLGTNAAVLFVVNRGDALRFRACHEACPLFAERLAAAVSSGVRVVACNVSWTLDGEAQFGSVIEDSATLSSPIVDGAPLQEGAPSQTLRRTRPAPPTPSPAPRKRSRGGVSSGTPMGSGGER